MTETPLFSKIIADRASETAAQIAIAATFTAEPIEEPLGFWLGELRLNHTIRFAPYNQVFQSLLDPSSIVSTNAGGINVILIRWQDLGAAEVFEANVDGLIDALSTAAGRTAAPIVVIVCPPAPEFVNDPRHQAAGEKLTAAVARLKSITVLTPDVYERWYPMTNAYDATSDRVGHVPYTSAGFAALATLIARRIDGFLRLPFKVIALDCDNTLWRGIVGEDGVDGISVSSEYEALQRFMIAQQEAGMLLTICSKNNEADVDEVFRTRDDMPLRRTHFVSSRVNWAPKSANLRELAAELDLGLDSFILVDDSAAECAEVQANCSDVLTLRLPEDPAEIPAFLNHVWALDQWQVTADDKNRTGVYTQKLERERVQKQATNIADFIASLDLQIDIAPMQASQLARVSQLTQRTNQFNCTTIRRSEVDIEALLNNGGYECLTVDVSDRFGHYGLVGVVIYRPAERTLDVDSFLLSCRALGRGVEHRVIQHLGRTAAERHLDGITIPFRPTAKNAPARLFLESIAGDFSHPDGDGFVLELPATYAAEVSYRPTDSVVIVEDEKKKKAPAGAPVRFRDYQRVAAALATPEQILEEMRHLRANARRSVGSDFNYLDEHERRIACIWQDVLGYERVGRDANFFEIGGHSLAAVRVLSRLFKDYPGRQISLTALLTAATVADVAALVTSGTEGEHDHIPRRPVGAPPMPSIGQEGLWYVQQLDPDSPFYSIPVAIQLRGELNYDAVREAVTAIAARHETLRTVIIPGTEGPSLIIRDPQPVDVEYVDLRSTPAALDTKVAESVRKPFRLEREAFRVSVFRTADQEHTVLININHVYADGWSMGVWRRDFARFYETALASRPAHTGDLPIAYSDFAAWEREWIDTPAASEQLAYWRKQLSDSQQVLALSTDRPRPPRLTYRGDVEHVFLSPHLVEKLTELGRTSNATLFMTLLAGWNALLYRYSGQEDILTGSAIANRTKAETQDLIGLFMNMVVLRGDLSGQPTFRELLARVRKTTLGAYANQEYPFEKLVEQLKPDRDPSRTPFYQNILILQTAATDSIDIPGLDVSWTDVHTGTAKTDLTLSIEPYERGLRGWLEYNTDLFDASTIRRMVEHYEVLLRAAIANPDEAISRLDLLTRVERQQVVIDWNRTEADYPRTRCTHHLFEDQAARTPDHIAAIDARDRLTYRELNDRANQLGHFLQKQGIGPDVLAGVEVERSVDLLVSLLGVLKAGGGYVPLDPIYPPERRAYMVADSGLKVLITDEYLRQNAAAIAAEPKTNCTSAVGPDNLAYVIYTSGSTGKPKGVEIQHRALLNLLWSFRREPGMHESDTLLAVTTISFDIAELEMYLPLLAGASVVIASRDAALNPKELARLLEQHRVTVMQATPATWQMLIESGWTGKRDLKILCGGEALSRELAGRLLPLSSELWNVYGPTETTIWSLVERITDASAPILIGRPIANTDVYILDKAGQPVPAGATGELLIGGDGVARGYHNRPDLTAEKFIQHPFSNRPGARLYRTGDLARCRADGRIECLGRVDFQVKIRGFRIELGEIESILAQRPDVARNVVVVREDTPGDKCIVAYVIPAPGVMFDAAAAQQHLRGALPEYMVPAHLVVLDELPLTPNKKVDRRALPPPARTERTERSYTPPRNALEEKLCRIWAELLHADRVGIHDDFFALGGHSLLAVRLFARVLNDYPDRNLTLSALLQAPTPAEFAALLNSSTTVSPACLVQMKSGSPDRLPLFCVPGAGGNVLSLRDLAMAMPDDLPFYCLQARGLDGISEPFHTVEESAAYYIQEIRSVQPHGPYNISGGCYGGMIAYEMARLLASQGEEVGLVALIDTYNFSFAKTLTKPVFLYCNARFAARRIAHHIAALRHVPAGERGAFLRRRFHALSKHFAVALAIAAGRDRNQMPIDGVPAQLEADEAGRMKDVLNRVLAISMKAAENYTPDKYSGRIILFKATERIEEPYQDDTLGWSKFAAEVEVHEIEANHITIADSQHVGPLAQILDAALRTVDERARNRHAYAAGVAYEASLAGSTISTGAQSS